MREREREVGHGRGAAWRVGAEKGRKEAPVGSGGTGRCRSFGRELPWYCGAAHGLFVGAVDVGGALVDGSLPALRGVFMGRRQAIAIHGEAFGG